MPDVSGDHQPESTAADIDRLLEAERTVHELAQELQRMRSAADLLDGSQQKVDAVLRSADAIVESAGRFTDDSVKILQRLQAIDLESRLGEILRASAETQALMGRQLNSLNEALKQLRERSKEDVGTLKQELSSEIKETVQGALTQTRNDVHQQTAALQEKVVSSRKLMLGVGAANLFLLMILLVVVFTR